MRNRLPYSFFFVALIAALFPAGHAAAGIESLVVPYTATEDVVYGQKEGMGLTLDVSSRRRTPRASASC